MELAASPYTEPYQSAKTMNTTQKQSIALPVVAGICLGIALGLIVDDHYYKTIVCQIVFLGIFSAMNSFFLEFCYQEGNIFGWWIDYLNAHVRDNKKHLLHPFYKPLGGCVYCQNIWIAMSYFLVTHFAFGVSWWLFFPVIMFSHFTLSLLDITFWRG